MLIFWENVRQALDSRGKNWTWLREKIGKASSTMSNMLKTVPRLDDGLRIAEALEIPVEELFYGTKRKRMPHERYKEVIALLSGLSETDLAYLKIVLDTLKWKNRFGHKAPRSEEDTLDALKSL